MFTNYLNVPKAAFFMPDESTAFLVPWVYRGIDRTTQHRLRLANEFLEALPGFQNGTTVTIERENLGALESYFSRREYSLVQRLRVLPFFDSDRLVAVFLVIESESSPAAPAPDLGLLEAVASTIAAKINSARAFLGHGAIEMRDDALRSHLASVFGEAESAGLYVTVARIGLAKLAERLMKDSTTADLYRFKQDLGAALTTMVSGSGELVSLGEHAALLIVQSRNPYSGRLLAHQFAEGVKGFLVDAPFVPDLSDQTWRYPSSGYSIDEVIDAILE